MRQFRKWLQWKFNWTNMLLSHWIYLIDDGRAYFRWICLFGLILYTNFENGLLNMCGDGNDGSPHHFMATAHTIAQHSTDGQMENSNVLFVDVCVCVRRAVELLARRNNSNIIVCKIHKFYILNLCSDRKCIRNLHFFFFFFFSLCVFVCRFRCKSVRQRQRQRQQQLTRQMLKNDKYT